MQEIIKFFTGISSAITSWYSFLLQFYKDLVFVIQLTAKFLTELPQYFSWLPGELLAIVVTCLGIVVVYKIMGREG